MRDALTGTAEGYDLRSVVAGDEVTVIVEGWHEERLTLTVTEIQPPHPTRPDHVRVYGLDPGNRLRLVCVRVAAVTSTNGGA